MTYIHNIMQMRVALVLFYRRPILKSTFRTCLICTNRHTQRLLNPHSMLVSCLFIIPLLLCASQMIGGVKVMIPIYPLYLPQQVTIVPCVAGQMKQSSCIEHQNSESIYFYTDRIKYCRNCGVGTGVHIAATDVCEPR